MCLQKRYVLRRWRFRLFLNLISRPNLPATTFTDTQVNRKRSKSYSSLHGKLPSEAMTSTSLPTRPPENFCTKSSSRRRKSSRTRPKPVYWPSTVVQSILTLHRKSFVKVKPKTTWNIRGLVKSSKGRSGRKHEPSIRKMVRWISKFVRLGAKTFL